MITSTYNETADLFYTDNGVVKQGVISKTIGGIAAAVSNRNHTPVSSISGTSFAKSFRKENPITEEVLSDGLASLFGAATGLDGIEMLIDYGTDAIDFYDDYIQDRVPHMGQINMPQPDPRLWMPTPHLGMPMAA